jgi:hypothetical protein
MAVSTQRRITAIRFGSDACRRAGTKGWNVAIFADAVVAPNRVRILGKSGASLEELPSKRTLKAHPKRAGPGSAVVRAGSSERACVPLFA